MTHPPRPVVLSALCLCATPLAAQDAVLRTAWGHPNLEGTWTPDHVVIQVEMNHDTRVIPLQGGPHLSPAIAQWLGDSRGRFEGDTLVVETRNFKFNEQSRFGVGYLNGLSDENAGSSSASRAPMQSGHRAEERAAASR